MFVNILWLVGEKFSLIQKHNIMIMTPERVGLKITEPDIFFNENPSIILSSVPFCSMNKLYHP